MLSGLPFLTLCSLLIALCLSCTSRGLLCRPAGYAQMASLVCAWLGLTEEEAGQGGADPAAGHGPPPGKKQRLDEAFFLRVGPLLALHITQ